MYKSNKKTIVNGCYLCKDLKLGRLILLYFKINEGIEFIILKIIGDFFYSKKQDYLFGSLSH